MMAAFMFACTTANKPYTIIGEVAGEGNDGKEVYLYSIGADSLLDTAIINNGKFAFEGVLCKSDIGRVVVNRRSTAFVLEPGDMTIKINEKRVGSVSGTPLNDVLQQYNNAQIVFMTEYTAVVDSLKEVYNEDVKGLQAEVNKFYQDNLKLRADAYFDEVYEKNKSNMVGVYFYAQSIARDKTPEEIDLYMLETPIALEYAPLKKVISVAKMKANTADGKMFTDFNARNIQDTSIVVKLSDYVGKGKYVLVDFWAAWCGPCVKEMPNLIKLHNELADKGLVVLSVNVWDEYEKALVGIKDMKMTWEQIFVPKGDNATELYGIQGIPTIILFAPDGTIENRSLRGENMVEYVENIFKK